MSVSLTPCAADGAGRVLTEEELRRVGDFCERHDLVLVSDEVHCDLILDEGLRHISMLALDGGVGGGRYDGPCLVESASYKLLSVPLQSGPGIARGSWCLDLAWGRAPMILEKCLERPHGGAPRVEPG